MIVPCCNRFMRIISWYSILFLGIMSVYSLFVSAPHVDAFRMRLALVRKEGRFGESLTHPQLQEILGAIEDREDKASQTEDIDKIKENTCTLLSKC